MNLCGLSLHTHIHTHTHTHSILCEETEPRASSPACGAGSRVRGLCSTCLLFCAARLGALGRGAERRWGGSRPRPPPFSAVLTHLLMQQTFHLPGVGGSR